MATIHNPTGIPLYCEPLKRELHANETADATEAQAAACGRAIFVVTTAAPVPEAPARRPVTPTRKGASKPAEER